MLYLGLDTWLWASIFKEENVPCIDTAAELGAEVIDFSINDPFSFPLESVKKKLSGYNMKTVVTTAFPRECNPISPDPDDRKRAEKQIKKLIDIAQELGSDIVGGVNYAASGYHTGHPRTEMEIGRAVEYLTMAAEYAASRNISIAMEPVKRFETHFLNTAEQALDLIERTGAPNIKVHLDTFHMNIEEADFAEAIEMCGDKLGHIHLVDSNRGAPGMGHVPWMEVFRALKKINYDGAGCFETFNPMTLDETASMTFLTRKFADTPEELARKGLTYLKALRTMTFEI